MKERSSSGLRVGEGAARRRGRKRHVVQRREIEAWFFREWFCRMPGMWTRIAVLLLAVAGLNAQLPPGGPLPAGVPVDEHGCALIQLVTEADKAVEPARGQLRHDLGPVIELAIERHMDAAVLVRHGLAATGRQVDDREPAMPKANGPLGPHRRVVRPAAAAGAGTTEFVSATSAVAT